MSVPKRRRTYLRADERRKQILGVAKEVFSRRGYRDANVADICEAAHIGRGTLYQYFQNKRDVLLAVVEDICARIQAILDRRRPVADIPGLDRAPLEMVVAVTMRRVREMLDAVFQDEATLRLVLRDARGLDGAVDEVLARIDAILLGAMESDIRAAQSAGLVRPDADPALVARFVLGGVEKVVLAALTTDGATPIDLDTIVRDTVQLQLFGILSPRLKEQTP
jgi:AcrR family transcriptional regulator